MKNKFFIYTFYRFKKIQKKHKIKSLLEIYLSDKLIRGTVLLADEGINGSISASEEDLSGTIKFIKKILRIRKLDIHVNTTTFLPFNKMKIRIKKEIVSLGKGNININDKNEKFIPPSKWDSVIKDKSTKIIDVRNHFEIEIGTFKGSLNPNTTKFREFPDKLKKLHIDKSMRIAMFCTGGIRCEKASAFLRKHGYKNIVQLDGGIIRYLNYKKKSKTKSMWNGECFVFDNRVTINKELLQGKYLQCHGCRRPITKKDTKSKYYKKGVSCPYCFNKRSIAQKKRSITRYEQITRANDRKIDHPFKRIFN